MDPQSLSLGTFLDFRWLCLCVQTSWHRLLTSHFCIFFFHHFKYVFLISLVTAALFESLCSMWIWGIVLAILHFTIVLKLRIITITVLCNLLLVMILYRIILNVHELTFLTHITLSSFARPIYLRILVVVWIDLARRMASRSIASYTFFFNNFVFIFIRIGLFSTTSWLQTCLENHWSL